MVIGQLWSVDGSGSDVKWLWGGCGSETSKVMEVVVQMTDNLQWQRQRHRSVGDYSVLVGLGNLLFLAYSQLYLKFH